MLHISESEVDKEAQAILNLVKNGENGIAVCYPTCKIGYNLLRFLGNKKLLKKYLGLLYRRFAFCIISLSSQDTEKTFLEKFRTQLKANNISTSANLSFAQLCGESLHKGKEPYLFLLDIHEVSREMLSSILNTIHNHTLQSSRVKTLIFLEQNIYHPTIFPLFKHSNAFLQNIIWITPLSDSEANHFIRTVCKEFNISLSEKFIHDLVDNLGGYIWILKAALRYMRDTNSTDITTIVSSPLVKMRLQILFDMFSDEEKQALVQLLSHKNPEVRKDIQEYFLQVGFIKETKQGYQLTLPAISSLIEKIRAANTLHVDEKGGVFFEKRDLQTLLTEYELKTLHALLNNKGKLLSRERIAEYIWGDSWADKYSDWALDKLISRLRKSLQKIGLPSTIITTRKRQGFLIE